MLSDVAHKMGSCASRVLAQTRFMFAMQAAAHLMHCIDMQLSGVVRHQATPLHCHALTVLYVNVQLYLRSHWYDITVMRCVNCAMR
jgi:hypothetical protein